MAFEMLQIWLMLSFLIFRNALIALSSNLGRQMCNMVSQTATYRAHLVTCTFLPM